MKWFLSVAQKEVARATEIGVIYYERYKMKWQVNGDEKCENPESETQVDKRNKLDEVKVENRNFLKIKLTGLEFCALFDPGVTVSLVSTAVVQNFMKRLQPADTFVKMATGEANECLRRSRATVIIDAVTDVLVIRASQNIEHEMILGSGIHEEVGY